MVTLNLTFSNPANFRAFLFDYISRAGSGWTSDQINVIGECNFEITGTPAQLYYLGYDWALYQFPPKT